MHIPHDATTIPAALRPQLLLSDSDLADEIVKMTDHLTGEIFAPLVSPDRLVLFPVSRLVVDVERFERDECEPMSRRGMGAIYTHTSDGRPLRAVLTAQEREDLMAKYYRPHHRRLEQVVTDAIAQSGRALVIDCHSFPAVALPYEEDSHSARPDARPDICIGTDSFHTPDALCEEFVRAFTSAGFSVKINFPFAGSIVPASRHGKDQCVESVMVEVNRGLYLEEATGHTKPNAGKVGSLIRSAIHSAISAYRA